MLLIRPIALEDLPALEAISHSAGFGLTSLPKDLKLLKRRIRASVRGFENLSDEDAPRGETYLFVLEETDTGRIAGTSGIVSKVGGFEPFYGYRLETSVHASAQLDVRRSIGTLHLVEQHDGPCEVGSLFLAPEFRGGGNGRLLSLARFLFMADHLEYFDPVVISELRGICDEQGRSPFWDAVGHHFFDIDYPSADYLSMVNKKFIADLMPRHPLYIPLLPFSAQAVIGKTQPQTEPALAILRDEGFESNGIVDIFDAGPVISCALKKIRAIHESKTAVIEKIAKMPSDDLRKPDQVADQPAFILTNTHQQFRACLGNFVDGTLEPATAAGLNVKVGDTIRYVSPRPLPTKESYDAPDAI